MCRIHSANVMKTLCLLVLLLCVISCSRGGGHDDEVAQEQTVEGGSSTDGGTGGTGDAGGTGGSSDSGGAAPTVVSISPDNGAVGVAADTKVSITFSQDISSQTATSENFTVSANGAAAPGSVQVSSATVTFTPAQPLLHEATYTVRAGTGLTDLQGNHLASDYTWSFTTAAAPAISKWTKVSTGWDNGVAINGNGSLWTWGCNYSGQLGIGTGGDHSEEHKYDSHVPIQIDEGYNWATVSSGHHYYVAVKTDGTLWVWGESFMGDGTKILQKRPIRIGGDADWQEAVTSCKYGFTFALKKNGMLWCWGYNASGQLGNGTSGTTAYSKVPILLNSDSDWRMVALGDEHTVALKTDNTLWTWGGNGYGQLGNSTGGDHSAAYNTNLPARIGSDADWKTIAANGGFTVAVKTNGSLWAWGDNFHGQLGDGTTVPKNKPTQIGDSFEWDQVAAGWNHVVAIRKDGSLWTWGGNNAGQLGDGSITDRHTPAQVGGGAEWAAAAAGQYISMGIKKDGTLWAWGFNEFGQVGDGTTTNKTTPVQIK